MTHVPGTNLFLLLNLVSGAPDDTTNEIQMRNSPVGVSRSGRNFRNENPCATRGAPGGFSGSAGVPFRLGFDVQTTPMSCMSMTCAFPAATGLEHFFPCSATVNESNNIAVLRSCLPRPRLSFGYQFCLGNKVLCSSFVPSGLRVLGYHGEHSEPRTAYGGCFSIRPCVFG